MKQHNNATDKLMMVDKSANDQTQNPFIMILAMAVTMSVTMSLLVDAINMLFMNMETSVALLLDFVYNCLYPHNEGNKETMQCNSMQYNAM